MTYRLHATSGQDTVLGEFETAEELAEVYRSCDPSMGLRIEIVGEAEWVPVENHDKFFEEAGVAPPEYPSPQRRRPTP